MAVLLPWQQATYKTLNIIRNIRYFELFAIEPFLWYYKSMLFFVILGIFQGSAVAQW